MEQITTEQSAEIDIRQFTVRVPDPMYRLFKSRCALDGMSLQEGFIAAIQKHLASQQQAAS